MKRSFLIITIVLLSFRGWTQELPFVKDPVFRVGEVLQYKLRYGIITAAEGTLKVLSSDLKFDGQPTYRLSVDGNTSGTFDVFYKIRDHYDSYIDQKDLKPYFYQENIREGSYRRQDKARFYQDDQKVVATKGTYKTPNKQTFDLVSTYYFARSLDVSKLKTGDMVNLNYFLSDEVNQLKIEFMGRETIKTKLGKIKCLKFSPSIKPGRIFRKDSRLYLWVTDDGNRVPVKAQVEILVGAVTMEIKSADGLKYPLAIVK
ncbi:hypothetical protein PBAL39_05463 [Pedobacter sp. BAL39]|uniref:DUF3108 domain-containing protein n=1 Tax=Pedobacter sp. BAL39 TaxID=391596 RepID=UPI00015599EE|nr:DUF3108 domain-containing protein [Pedobacter sp. BAL39]EDM37221.1 hypothetical protein PBAL39_05463 [Pedobacter sp. BAL39]